MRTIFYSREWLARMRSISRTIWDYCLQEWGHYKYKYDSIYKREKQQDLSKYYWCKMYNSTQRYSKRGQINDLILTSKRVNC